MSREIKFRVGNIYKGGYTLVGYEQLIDGEWHWKRVGGKKWTKGVFTIRSPLSRLEVKIIREQFIGLKDKNGKEIYESDLVRWDDITYEIKWHGEYGWFMKDDREDWDCPNLYAQELVNKKGSARVEVVGNIYETR